MLRKLQLLFHNFSIWFQHNQRLVDSKHNVFAGNIWGVTTHTGIMNRNFVRHIVSRCMTGSGQSAWAKTLFLDNVKKGGGVILLESHGKLVDEILEVIPSERSKDAIEIDDKMI